VGAALTEKLGGSILRALASERSAVAAAAHAPVYRLLESWRLRVAREMGVPNYVIASDGLLRAIALARPRTGLELSRIRGVGPRTLAKFGDALLGIVAEVESHSTTLDPEKSPRMDPVPSKG
jgi:ATP-dependent DNA helicase RecQ